LDKTVKVWDAASGRELRTLSGHTGGVVSVAFSPDGKTIVSGSRDDTVKLWDTASGRELRTLSGHTGSVDSVAFSPDGKTVVSGSVDDTVKLWDAASGGELRTLSGHTAGVDSTVFSPDGKTVVSGSSDGTVRIWDTETGKELAQFVGFSDGEWVCITPDGFYNTSPNGDKHLNVRAGNSVYGIDQYRATFYRPQILEARLGGTPDPVPATVTIQQIQG
jgi:WD40 repeat protein